MLQDYLPPGGLIVVGLLAFWFGASGKKKSFGLLVTGLMLASGGILLLLHQFGALTQAQAVGLGLAIAGIASLAWGYLGYSAIGRWAGVVLIIVGALLFILQQPVRQDPQAAQAPVGVSAQPTPREPTREPAKPAAPAAASGQTVEVVKPDGTTQTIVIAAQPAAAPAQPVNPDPAAQLVLPNNPMGEKLARWMRDGAFYDVLRECKTMSAYDRMLYHCDQLVSSTSTAVAAPPSDTWIPGVPNWLTVTLAIIGLAIVVSAIVGKK